MKPSTQNIAEFLQELARQDPNKKLLGSSSGWMTAQQVMATAGSMGFRLLAAGIRPQNYVALQAKRTSDTVLMLLALRLIGAAAVLTDPFEETEKALAGTEVPIAVSAVLTSTGPGKFLLQKDGETSTVPVCADNVPMFLSPAAKATDPGYVIFTSGSTGKKKAVVLSDYNLVNNLLDSQPLGCYSKDDIALGALPLEHVFGLVLLAGMAVLRYALFLPDTTDIDSLLHCIEHEKITRMNGVPSLYQAMADEREKYDLSSLRAGFIGGAPITAERMTEIEKRLDMILIPVYGMSECIGISCASWKDPVETRAAGVGKIYSMNTVRILSECGAPAAEGQTGEIWVNGPARMLGYWGVPMAPEDFLPTGDMGYLGSDGTLHICSRKKDIIIRNGRNISPRTIEDALLSLPGVRNAVVVGLSDEQVGELPYAMVVGVVDPAELKPLLPKYELPAGIMCVDELPLTFSGKPDKIQIREVLSKWKNG